MVAVLALAPIVLPLVLAYYTSPARSKYGKEQQQLFAWYLQVAAPLFQRRGFKSGCKMGSRHLQINAAKHRLSADGTHVDMVTLKLTPDHMGQRSLVEFYANHTQHGEDQFRRIVRKHVRVYRQCCGRCVTCMEALPDCLDELWDANIIACR
jgi:hypothetical protein